ncbi:MULTISPECIES: phage holin [unclassified Lysinibacillus]|uniref:phage holin n=1 Tax=unclassified Lysinibacillus TaxID=2636778 RepID=UPI0030FA74ED
MKINWKVRICNPQFWITFGLSIITPLFAYYGITGADLTTWGSVWTLMVNALSNPYVLALMGVSIYNAVLDPTTANLSDSQRALAYVKPKRDDFNDNKY